MKIKNIKLFAIVFVYFFVFFSTSGAKSVTVSSQVAPQLGAPCAGSTGTTCSLYRDSVGLTAGIYSTITYGIEITSSTGKLISDGDVLPVGASFTPVIKWGDVWWHFTGGILDTPYGYWLSSNGASGSCGSKGEYINIDFGTFSRGYYLPFYANYPSVSVSKTGTGKYFYLFGTYIVTTPGTFNFNFNFNSTTGVLYASPDCNRFVSLKGPLLTSAYQFNFPASNINYSFSAERPISTNNPPDVSLRYSPNTPPHPLINEEVTLYVTGTDPDPGDKVQYQIDLIDDGKQEAQYFLPSSSTYTESGTELPIKKTWIDSGTKNIWVKTIDDKGGDSGWKPYQITVTNPCGNNTIDTGEQCDGSNLNGRSCPFGGTISCNATCDGFIEDNCNTSPPPVCGDGIKNQAREECDGLDLGVATCPSSRPLGRPTCNSDCTINDNTCYSAVCGDGRKEGVEEECDKGPSNGSRTSGCSKDCKIVPVLPACLVNGRCEIFNGENPVNCPKDCPATIKETQAPKPSFWAFVLGALGFR